MNFIFISPQFPHTYWNFCSRLKRNGVNVLAIGDTPYDALSSQLKESITEYYRVNNMESYDEMYRAVAFFAFKYGRIDWLESNNEYWLEQDAKLRTDFNITTGVDSKGIKKYKSKYEMKKYYIKAGVPVARIHKVSDIKKAKKFVDEIGGYPIIAKPECGVGAAHTYKITNDAELEYFFNDKPDLEYVMEEFIDGDIVSYDVITNSECEPLFESMTNWPPSIADIVNNKLDWTDLNFINQQRYDESPEIKLSVGDVLIVKDGAGIGKTARIDELPNGESTVNSSLGVITPSEMLDYKYLHYFLLSNPFQNMVSFLKNGMGVPHLTQENMKSVRIPVPEIEEQQLIATYLDEKTQQIDSLIALKLEKIEELKVYKKSIIYEYVTGKKRV